MRREIYRGRVVNLGMEDVVLPSGVATTLEILRHPGAAAVAAVDDAGRVVLLRQYRHAAGAMLWEIPAGVREVGEEPAACAHRELAEEAGLGAACMESLGTIVPTPGYSDERIHLFLARGLSATAMAHEADEAIERIERVPLGEAVAMVRRGEIVDGKTALGLFLAAAALGDGA